MQEFWVTVGTAIQQEFSDINDVSDAVRIVVRLLLASVLGGVIGYERESKGKSAGLRTHMLVSLGAALFVLAPALSGMEVADMSRVLQGIIAGIGFLGAGAIIKSRGSNDVKGLTTAASIWLTAAVGITAGMGREMLAVTSTLFALFILAALRGLETRIEEKNGNPHDDDGDGGESRENRGRGDDRDGGTGGDGDWDRNWDRKADGEYPTNANRRRPSRQRVGAPRGVK